MKRGELREEIKKELEGFWVWLEQFQIADSTRKKYYDAVKKFLRLRGKTFKESPPSEEEINKYLKEHPRLWIKRGIEYYLKYNNINMELQKIKEPERKLKKQDFTDYDTLKYMIEHRINWGKKHIYLVFKIALFTGARIHEILSLRLSDLIEENGMYYIRFPKTKTHKERIVPVPEDLYNEIIEYFKEEVGRLSMERLFYPNINPQKIPIEHALYVKFRKDIIRYVRPKHFARMLLRTHKFRRAVVNMLLEKTGYNIYHVAAFMGQHIQTVDRYVSDLTREKAKIEVFKKVFGGGENENKVEEKENKAD